MNLTNLGLAQTLFRKEKPSREAVRVIQHASQDQLALEPDRVRELGDDRFAFEFVGDRELKELLDQARGFLPRAHGDLSMNDLLKLISRPFIERKSPRHRRNRAKSPAAPRVTVRPRPAGCG